MCDHRSLLKRRRAALTHPSAHPNITATTTTPQQVVEQFEIFERRRLRRVPGRASAFQRYKGPPPAGAAPATAEQRAAPGFKVDVMRDFPDAVRSHGCLALPCAWPLPALPARLPLLLLYPVIPFPPRCRLPVPPPPARNHQHRLKRSSTQSTSQQHSTHQKRIHHRIHHHQSHDQPGGVLPRAPHRDVLARRGGDGALAAGGETERERERGCCLWGSGGQRGGGAEGEEGAKGFAPACLAADAA